MKTLMAKLMTTAAVAGAVLSIGIVSAAHSSNGFESGPIILLALVLSGLGATVTGILAFVGKRGQPQAAVGAFTIAMFVVLVL